MKNKKLYITLGILSIIFLGLGGTFAYLTASATATNITQIKSGNMTMTIDGGGSGNVTLFPATCTSNYAIKKTIKASAINTSGGKVSFSIGMNVATLSSDFKRDTMKYALTTTANSCTDGLVASGNFSNATVGSDIWLIKNDYDGITNSSNTYTKTYYLYIWLDQSETENLSGNISVTMKGTSSNNPNLKTMSGEEESSLLYDVLKNNADTTTTIDFSQSSVASNTNGIYMTTDTDSGNSVYYYRGNVDNHLIFANFCWRIVRTTEAGGTKLIYDGVPSNGQCNNTGDDTAIGQSEFNETGDAKFVGYMYGSSIDDTANTNDSIIKGVIDTWYKNNMTNYTSQLEDTVFCSDRSYTQDSDYNLTFGAVERQEPTLKCQNARDKFTVDANNGNGSLTYPVGLITADEVVYAGCGNIGSNKSFYLYTGKYYWALSPNGLYFSYGEADVYYMGSSGYFSGAATYYSYGVRPVLALKQGTEISGGSGTSTDPYIVN